MRLGGVLADDQLRGDLAVGEAARHQQQDFALTLGQRRERGSSGGGGCGEALDGPPGPGRREQGAALCGYPDGRQQLLLLRVLEEEGAGTGAQRVVDVLVEVE